MGQCKSVNLDLSDRRSALLDRQLAKESTNLAEYKVLLLGPGESGKSTLMKQLTQLYGTGHDPERYRPVVFRNIINNIIHLIQKSEEWQRDTPFYGVDSSLTITVEQVREVYEQTLEMNFNDIKALFQEHDNLADNIEALWKDKGIQHVYEQRSRTQLLDSAPYFFEKIHEIGEDGYLPNTTDIIRCRIRTTGFTECNFDYNGHKMTVTDVGGQRSERKKWLHFFDECSVCVFFVGLSEYDRNLFEDESVNRMEEALHLFYEICNSRWFHNTSMILFLNKADLFREKIEEVPIKDFFPAFTEEQTYDNSCKFFKDLFGEKNMFKRPLYTHITNMIDENEIPRCFEAIAKVVLERSGVGQDEMV